MQSAPEVLLTSPTLKNPVSFTNNYGYWIVLFFSAVMMFFIGGQVLGWFENEEKTLIGNSLKTVIGIVGIIMSYSVTRHIEGKLKKTWRILTLAYLFNTGGDTIWYYYASILGEVPFPSWGDLSFLISYPVMLWALLTYPTQDSNLDRKKLTADISIVMVSGITIVWYFIINPTISTITEENWISPALNLSYTVGDMVLILGILVAFFRGVEDGLKRALQIIVGGVVCMLIADLGFAYLTLQGTYFGGHWIENFFIFNSLSHIYAAYYQYCRCQKESELISDERKTVSSRSLNLLPYLAIASAAILLLWESFALWTEPVGKLIISLIFLTILGVFRQIIGVRENYRLLSEQARKQSEAHLSELVQNSSDLISILDLNGSILFESPSIKNVLGYEKDELVGKASQELVHPEDLIEREKILETLVSGQESVIHKEIRFKHKDGSWRVLETVSKLMTDAESKSKSILVNSRDVTSRKRDEEKLAGYTQKLEASNRDLQDFAYVASHDLIEPLRKVQAFGDRLKRKYAERLGAEGDDYINRMQGASIRMQTLIDGLLEYSRVSTKTQPFVPTDLAEVCREVISDLEVRIERTKAIVEIGKLPTIEADSLQIRQLLQNLISNALKFQKEGHNPHLKIYSASNKSHQIFIEDNGIGFDEKYLDRIFGVFQRLHGRGNYEGSGIGLSVCKKIVERHQGKITARSEIGVGTTFIITLPIKSTEYLGE